MKILDILVEDEYIDPKERKRQQQERDKAAMDGKVLFVQLKPDQRQGVLGEITTVLDKPINQYLSSVFNKNASYFNLRALDKTGAFHLGHINLPSSGVVRKDTVIDVLHEMGVPYGCLWTLIPNIQQRKQFLITGADIQKIDYQIRLEMLAIPGPELSHDANYKAYHERVSKVTSLGSSVIDLPFSSGTGKQISSNDPNRLAKLKTDIYRRLDQAGDVWLKPLVSNLIR